jgi:uracil-DNA glycosylase family 4
VIENQSPRDLLRRYLRQQLELGRGELYLDASTTGKLLESLRAPEAPPGTSRRGTPNGEHRPLTARAARHRELQDDALGGLRAEVLGCTRCRLSENRRTVVFGEGDPSADLLVVGEAPGLEEDRSGRPFVGPAGQLLDKMLAAIGFRRDEVFICNVLKCRPPNNRDPLGDEVASGRPYLRRQVELIKPKAICAFGRFAAQTLLTSEASLSRLRGATHDFMGIPVVATYHPAALLRNTQWKRPAWEDLKFLRQVYDEAGGRPPGGERA